MDLWRILNDIKDSCRFVELSHVVSPDTPHWPGFPDMKSDSFFNYEDDGYYANEYHMVSQYGTHVDAPCHFIPGTRSLDSITAEEMILPLCVVDVSEKVAAEADYAATVEDIKAWEAVHGTIPSGAFVALRTDWSKREDMDNCDAVGNKHYPGWDVETVKFLIEERHITTIGHETCDTDPAFVSAVNGYPAETYILERQHYQVELLKNLDLVPASGAIVICAFPIIKDGSGSTARCIAICKK